MVTGPRLFLPEVHDLHPGMADRIDALRDLIPPESRHAISWLVVPNWQDKEPISHAPDLANRLRGLGGTQVLHGWTHSRGRDWANFIMYGHDNRSEFRGITTAEATVRLDFAHAMFRTINGTAARWFCAPRWQQTLALGQLLRARGYHGWLDRQSVALATGDRLLIPALNFDDGERRLPQAFGHLRRRGAIRSLLATGQSFRLALHPDDLDRPAILRQISDLVSALHDSGWQARSLAHMTGLA